MRGVLVCFGLAVLAVGLVFTFGRLTVDGFTVSALVGWGIAVTASSTKEVSDA